MEFIIETFGRYYGLDWLSVVFGLVGLYLITQKNRYGFLCTIVSVVFAAIFAVLAAGYGFIIANVITAIIAARGFLMWKEEPK